MFESLFENLLKSILGEYVENIDSQKLSINVWGGKVSLNDLRLKPDIFYKFNLPFDVNQGVIRSLNFDVPWSRLSS